MSSKAMLLLVVLCTGCGGAAAQAAPAPEAEAPCPNGKPFSAADCPNGSCWASEPNGCGSSSQSVISEEIVPDRWPGGVDFSSSCIAHDYCYRTLGADRAACDQAFLDSLRKECERALGGGGGSGGVVGAVAEAVGGGENPALEGCYSLAQTYYDGIRAAGQQPFDEDQAQQAEHERLCQA